MNFKASLSWLVGLAVLSRVHGVPDCAPASNTLTLKTSQDVTDLSTCTTFTGNIVITGDGLSDIVLDGLQTVSGNIEIDNVTDLRSLSSVSLKSISSFTLNNLPLLESIQLPALTNFSSLLWTALPNLSNCTIATGEIGGEIQNITIADTGLLSLDWLAWPIGAGLNITENPSLTTFKIPYSSINAGSAITISSNTGLQHIDVSSLTNIYGGLAIFGNNISDLSFQNLQSINGFVQLSGAYTNITMPALNQINGALRVDSSEPISPFCNDLQAKKLAGHYDCISDGVSTTGASAPSPTPSDGALTDGSPVSSGTERAAIGGVVGGIFLSMLVALGVFWCRRRRAAKQVQEITPLSSVKDVEAASVGTVITPRSSTHVPPKELEGSAAAVEMAVQGTVLELATADARVETDEGSKVQDKRSTVRYELPA